ncbi:MAG TPA: Gfo/Idh/MocA family oxidoreductase [Devosia sp.]|jgi:predicted dehydrogenase|uniref:Gfo/Idh/MocA family protein n=1 Tax=Devosia sp. TaxID=1871048 RepID=UPI002DDCC27C|nr:Gfo/Idh/MocA family oxidoreductase [Devosia sp.]HEV2518190.1 Gfo/Idh/MocA family oxidoreductase [Devosia sp.]
MKFGVIGAGIFGSRHIQTFDRHPDAELVGVLELNRERAEAAVAKFASGPVPIYTDLNEFLAIPGLQAVSVATPDHLHTAPAIAAAKAGMHLLVEKPLATTVAEARAIVDAAKEGGGILMVDFHNRVNPPFADAYQAVRDGRVGEVKYVYARLSNTVAIAKMIKWASSSSSLWFLASHMVDVAQWIVGERIVKVTARESRGVLESQGINTPDLFVIMAEFESGALAVFEHAWILPEGNPTNTDLKFEVLGSDGALYIDTTHNRTLEIHTADTIDYPAILVPPYGPRMTGFVLDAIAQFVDAANGRGEVLATGEEGLQVTAVLEAILESIKSGGPVQVQVP